MGMQQTLRALADPSRREILNMLKKGRMSAGEIAERFSVSGAAVSRHLCLKKLILSQTSGRESLYIMI